VANSSASAEEAENIETPALPQEQWPTQKKYQPIEQ
jgi:hypothetical protein